MECRSPKNVFVVGAQCTGKTTLVNALKDHYEQTNEANIPKPGSITEVARGVIARLEIHRDEIANSPTQSLRLQKEIMQAQYNAEEAITRNGTTWYISDRSGIDPIVYAHFLIGEDVAEELLSSATWPSLESNMRKGLVFLCEPVPAWLKDDGQRLMQSNENWLAVHETFRRLLERTAIKYTIISKDTLEMSERVKLIVSSNCQAQSRAHAFQ